MAYLRIYRRLSVVNDEPIDVMMLGVLTREPLFLQRSRDEISL
jgi:hypothetical protein